MIYYGIGVALPVLLFQTILWICVLWKPRSDITQVGLGCVGMIPVLGIYVLLEQVLYEAGAITRPPGKPLESPPDLSVGKVSDRTERM